MKTKKWNIAWPDINAIRKLTNQCGYAPLTAAVLCARGMDTPEKAADFLSHDLSGLHDPFLLPLPPVFGSVNPAELTTVIGTTALTDCPSAVIVTAFPFTVALAVSSALPQISQIALLSSFVEITTVMSSFNSVYPLSVAVSVMT